MKRLLLIIAIISLIGCEKDDIVYIDAPVNSKFYVESKYLKQDIDVNMLFSNGETISMPIDNNIIQINAKLSNPVNVKITSKYRSILLSGKTINVNSSDTILITEFLAIKVK